MSRPKLSLAALTLLLGTLAAGSAFAGVIDSMVTEVHRDQGYFVVGGHRIYADRNQLSSILPNSRYLVHWEERDGRNIAMSVANSRLTQ